MCDLCDGNHSIPGSHWQLLQKSLVGRSCIDLWTCLVIFLFSCRYFVSIHQLCFKGKWSLKHLCRHTVCFHCKNNVVLEVLPCVGHFFTLKRAEWNFYVLTPLFFSYLLVAAWLHNPAFSLQSLVTQRQCFCEIHFHGGILKKTEWKGKTHKEMPESSE